MMIKVVKDYTFIIDGHEVTVKASSRTGARELAKEYVENLEFAMENSDNSKFIEEDSYSEDNNMY